MSIINTETESAQKSSVDLVQTSHPGIGRAVYAICHLIMGIICYGVGYWSACVYYNTNPSNIDAIQNTLLLFTIILSLFLVGYRLLNIGKKPYLALLSLIPIVNIYIGFLCLIAPPGYAKTKKLDTSGKIIGSILLVIVVVLVALTYTSIFEVRNKFNM